MRTTVLEPARAHLQLVTDASAPRARLLATVAAAARGGVDAVQIRDRSLPASDLLALAIDAAERTRDTRARILVNDRVDVAVASGADGVHLPQRGLSPTKARAMLLPGQLLGVSVHSLAEALAAQAEGADYVIFGHIFATASHADEAPRGVAQLRAVVEALRVPVIAIGGIDARRVAEVMGTGCAGVAVIGAIAGRDDPESATRELRAALDASGPVARPVPERRAAWPSR